MSRSIQEETRKRRLQNSYLVNWRSVWINRSTNILTHIQPIYREIHRILNLPCKIRPSTSGHFSNVNLFKCRTRISGVFHRVMSFSAQTCFLQLEQYHALCSSSCSPAANWSRQSLSGIDDEPLLGGTSGSDMEEN